MRIYLSETTFEVTQYKIGLYLLFQTSFDKSFAYLKTDSKCKYPVRIAYFSALRDIKIGQASITTFAKCWQIIVHNRLNKKSACPD